jgi:hypothetical protein
MFSNLSDDLSQDHWHNPYSFESLESDKARATEVLDKIRRIYAVEASAKDAADRARAPDPRRNPSVDRRRRADRAP